MTYSFVINFLDLLLRLGTVNEMDVKRYSPWDHFLRFGKVDFVLEVVWTRTLVLPEF